MHAELEICPGPREQQPDVISDQICTRTWLHTGRMRANAYKRNAFSYMLKWAWESALAACMPLKTDLVNNS